jgi:hypothetical protein
MALPDKYKRSDDLIGWLSAFWDAIGTLAIQNANNVAITGGSITGLSTFTGPDMSGVPPNDDLNDITRNGWYRFDSLTANTPTTNGICLHMARTSAIWAQLALAREGNARAWIRRKNNAGTISAWEAVATLTEAQTFTNKTYSGGTLSGTFSGNPIFTGIPDIQAAIPVHRMTETDAASDNKNWDWLINSAQLRGRIVNDAQTVAANWVTVDRSGITVTTVNFPNGALQSKGIPVRRSVTGTFTTASLASGAEETTNITHGLGTDNVMVTLMAKGNTSALAWTATATRPDSLMLYFWGGSTATATTSGTPSSGQVRIISRNVHGSAQTITVQYQITALD